MSRLRRRTLHLPHSGGGPRAERGTRAVVIGGGIAGIAAAASLAERGVHVVLLERESYLGGRAGGFAQTLATGERVQVERGFHGFFRQYYNLRALLRRVDPGLHQLTPLAEYPVFGSGGVSQTFRNGGRGIAPLQVLKVAWQTPHLGMLDLARIDARKALEMVRFHPERTYQAFDHVSADAYLSSLAFPERARRMLFDVFAHSFFNPEAEMSAGELLMMFHFYFTGNPEGLVFDVARAPMSTAFFRPFELYLSDHGATVCKGTAARRVRGGDFGGYCVEHDAGRSECDLLVLALDVAALKQLVAHSPELPSQLQRAVHHLDVTRPFGVLRLWLDRPLAPERPAFAGTNGVGELDSIAVYDRFQDESATWAQRHAGSVVELHGYALRLDDAGAIRADLLAGLHALYPESRRARVIDERFLLRQDCPAFAPGSHATRPSPDIGVPNLTIAGDFVRMPFPCALMERAAASGVLAANLLLAARGVAPQPIYSVPNHGLLAPLHASRSHALGVTQAR
jgi:isorenieratene synthase